jgi:hypothetical protein
LDPSGADKERCRHLENAQQTQSTIDLGGIKALWPFLWVGLLALILITSVPALSMLVPNSFA